MMKYYQKLSLLVTVLLIAGCTATPPSPSKEENSTDSKTKKTGSTEYSLDRKENKATTPPISLPTPSPLPSAKEASPVGTEPTLK